MTQEITSKKPRVLFICTGNTARSQMAQVLLEQRAPDRFEVVSAGLEPGEVNPLTVAVLQGAGLPVDHLHSKGVKPLIAEHFHYVVTVCDRAEASCPIFPNARYRLSWPFEDLAAATGSDQERLAVFIRVRGEIDARIQGWLASVWGISSVLGPLTGGLIIQHLSWNWIFWINLPIGLAAAMGFTVFLREDVASRVRSLDVAGAALFAVTIAALMLAITEAGTIGGGGMSNDRRQT